MSKNLFQEFNKNFLRLIRYTPFELRLPFDVNFTGTKIYFIKVQRRIRIMRRVLTLLRVLIHVLLYIACKII